VIKIIYICKKGSRGIENFCESLRKFVNETGFLRAHMLKINILDMRLFFSIISTLTRKYEYILHINYATIAKVTSLLGLESRTVFTVHGIPQPKLEDDLFYKLLYSLEEKCLHETRSKKIVTISNYASKILECKFNINPAVIHNGVDHNLFYPTNNKDLIKSKLGFARRRIILNVGRFNSYKNQIILLNALNNLPSTKLTQLLIVFVGSGPLERELRKISKKIESNKGLRTLFLSNISTENLRLIYQAADIYVHTSINEMFGLSLLEAMSSGLPVISSHGGAAKEILGEEYDLYFDPQNAEKLSALMDWLTEDSISREEYARQCYYRSLIFDWRKTFEQYLKIYEEVINEN
jgi:glycosyltransferase involved in cell wall biosynthesis